MDYNLIISERQSWFADPVTPVCAFMNSSPDGLPGNLWKLGSEPGLVSTTFSPARKNSGHRTLLSGLCPLRFIHPILHSLSQKWCIDEGHHSLLMKLVTHLYHLGVQQSEWINISADKSYLGRRLSESHQHIRQNVFIRLDKVSWMEPWIKSPESMNSAYWLAYGFEIQR